MSKKTKIWLVIAASLVLVGATIFGGVMTVLKWDFTKLSTNKYETKNYEINEDFNVISINTDTADIKLKPSEDSKCRVLCYEQKNVPHSVMVKDNTLVIEAVDKRKWYEYIGINFGTPKITVYLPKAQYTELFIKESTGDIEVGKDFEFNSADISLSTGDIDFFASAKELIKIKTSTGSISLEDSSAKAFELSASTGGISLSNVISKEDITMSISTGKNTLNGVRCKNLISSGTTGNILLKDVVASEKFTIKRSTGDVKIDSSDAGEIFIKTDTGDVVGSLLKEKVFITHTDTGKINVPKTVSGGRCEISTDTGDIKINIIN